MENVHNFLSAIKNAKNILISTHEYPDADGIGSQIGLTLALRELGKNAICVNEEALLERYHYLDATRVVLGLEEYKALKSKNTIDLVIVVDTNTIERTGKKFKSFYESLNCPILYIDHHPCTKKTADGNCIDTRAAATGQLIAELIEVLGVQFSKEMALPLYTAILIDTSSFRYPTVSHGTHEIIAKLMKAGVKAPMAYNGIYGTKDVKHMHLLGKVLSSADSTHDGEVAWIILNSDDLKKYDTDIEDTHAYINHLLILDNIKVACMFRDDVDHVKLSLRSTGTFDVGKIARGLGGGGHSHSAATFIEFEGRNFQQVIKDSIKKIENLLDEETS